jgi:predicted MarR family transcription regulator
VADLLTEPYSAAQVSYDLRRLRLHGLITRIPRTNPYATTPKGIRVAAFYTKVHGRTLPAPPADELTKSNSFPGSDATTGPG